MSKKFTEFMAEKYMLPMMRIICMAKTSEQYNYLPGEKEDPENLAGCYFDGELESVRENIRHCRCISPEMRKKLLEHAISCFFDPRNRYRLQP